MINIIGGGIAGMTIAIVLAKLGIKSEIFEKRNKHQPIGGTLTLFPNSIRILKRIDCFDSINKNSWPINQVVFLDSNLKFLAKRELGNEKIYGEPTIGIKRQNLIESLNSITIKLGINFNYNELVTNFNALNKFTIIADGSASINRVALNKGHTRIFSKIIYFGGYIKCDVLSLEIIRSILNIENYNQTVIINGPTFIGFTIIKNNDFSHDLYWYTHINADNPISKEELNFLRKNIDITKIISLNKNLPQEILKYLKKTYDIVVSNIYETYADKLCYSNNYIIIGDAAHSINPLSGQGAGMAIEDAYIFGNFISKNLSLISKNKDIINILEKIYNKRNLRVNKIQRKALFSCRVSALNLPNYLYYIRNRILSLQFLLIPNKYKNKHYINEDI
jgi:salicylate hydroxylase